MTHLEIPRLETDRLVLRAYEPADHPRLAAYFQDAGSHFTGGPRTAIDSWTNMAAACGSWVLRGFGMWAIADKTDNRYLGRAGGHCPVDWPEPEIGYWLHPDARGQGLAFEAVQRARQWLYGVKGWTTAVSYVDPQNTASKRLAERLGAVLEDEIVLRETPALVYRHPSRIEGVTA
ncbi:MAG: GNAT family N-acetyltransferase [Pseudomonadota bacterium]